MKIQITMHKYFVIIIHIFNQIPQVTVQVMHESGNNIVLKS